MGSGWSPQDIMALFRRHLMAVTVLFVLVAGLAYHLQRTQPGYLDTATVAFTAPAAGLFGDAASLLVIDELTANSVTSAAGQQQVRNAGGTTAYHVVLVNLNTEDFPNYGEPYVTATTTAPDPAASEHTLSAVLKVLQRDLVALQARQGAKPKTWIQLRVIASTGPIAQTGSRKRALAGLAILAIIVAFMVASFLDRHPVRLRDLLQRRDRPDTRDQLDDQLDDTLVGRSAIRGVRPGADSSDGES